MSKAKAANPIQKLMDLKFINIAKRVINEPKVFFSEVASSKEIKPHLKYLAFLWVTGSVLMVLGNLIFAFAVPWVTSLVTKTPVQFEDPFDKVLVAQIVGIPLNIVFGIVLTSLLGTLVLHIWIKIWRGKGSLQKTFILSTYSLTPTMLFGWVPLASIVASLYGIYLNVVGAEALHGIERRKAILMFVFVPLGVMIFSAILSATIGLNLPKE